MGLRVFSLGLVLALGVVNLIGCCRSDTPITTTSTSTAYADFTTCEAARTATNACPVITSDPGCTAYCKASSMPGCLGSVTKASSTVGNACFPQQSDEKYYYSCVNQATCHCV